MWQLFGFVLLFAVLLAVVLVVLKRTKKTSVEEKTIVHCQEKGEICSTCDAVIEGKVFSPVINLRRPPCPFYGFVGMAGILIDNKGNACGIAGEHTPCKMEMHGEKPDWMNCGYYNNAERAGEFPEIKSVRVFPNELLPVGTHTWSGISFPEWYERVMSKQ